MRSLPPPMDFDTLRTKAKARTNLPPIVYGQAISLFGDYIAYFTLPLFIVFLTASAADLGLTAAAETVPMLLFGLAAGVFLDRRARLTRTLVFADGARAVAFIALAVGAYTDVANTWMVFGAAFIVGTMSVLFDSGLQALLPSVLEDDMLLEANARLQLARTAAMTIGPATGGVLVAVAGGFGTAFLVNAGTFILSGVFLASVRPVRAPAPVAQDGFRAALTEGLGFLMSHSKLRWATLGGTVTNLVFAPLEALLVLFVAEEVGLFKLWFLDRALAPEASIGLFFALQAAIGSIGIYFAPRIAERMRLGRMYLSGLVMMGGGFALVAVMPNYFAVIPTGMALAGAGWVNVSLSTMRQQLTPRELLGRVIAASRTLAWAGLPIGAAAGGFLGEAVGIIPVYVAGSSAVLLIAVVLRFTTLWEAQPTTAGAAIGGDSVDESSVGIRAPRRQRRSLRDEVIRSTEAAAREPLGPVEGGLLAVTAVGLGSVFVVSAEALETLTAPVVAGSIAVAAVLITAASPAARRAIGRPDWVAVGSVGVGWVALPILIVVLAIDRAPSAQVGMMMGAIPLVAAAVSAIGARRWTAMLLVGQSVGIAGAVLVARPWTGTSWTAGSLAAGAAAAFGALWLITGVLQQRYGAPGEMLWAWAVASVVLVPVAAVGWSGSRPTASSVVAALAVGGLLAASLTAMVALVGRVGLARAGVGLYFVPVVAALLGAALRSETIPAIAILGAGLLIVGVSLSARQREPAPVTPTSQR